MRDTHSKAIAWLESKRTAHLVDWLLAASFVLPLIAYAYLGSYSRYMADDYSALRPVITHGFFGAQIHWYQAWTGRFSFTFVNSLVALFGPATPRVVPGLLLTLWLAAAVWASYQIYSSSGRIPWARVVLLPAFLIFATLETAPNVSQSLYWQTGALTYVAPLIPLSLYVGTISRSVNARHKGSYRFSLFFAGILTVVAGGFSEPYVVLQTCGLLVALLAMEGVAQIDFRLSIRPFLLVALAGSLLALVIVALAPGNSVRQAYLSKQFGGWEVLGQTIFYSVRFVAELVLTHPIIFSASVIVPILFVLRDFSHGNEPTWDRRLCIRILLIIPPAVLLLIMCSTVVSVYATSVMLPERARILLSLTLVCSSLIWSRAAGEYLAGRFLSSCQRTRIISLAATVALLLVILAPQMSFFSILHVREQARAFAADWDRQDSTLKIAKQSGVTDVTVQQIGDFQSRIGKGPSDLHLRTDPGFWINRTTASYYGLTSVRATQNVPNSVDVEQSTH